MFALIGNFDLAELGVVLLAAILVFGRRLPEVAMRTAAQVAKLRRQLQKMWREAGLEDELRRVRDEVERDMPDASMRIDPIGDLRRTVEAPLREPPPRAADLRREAEQKKLDEHHAREAELQAQYEANALDEPEELDDLDATVALPRSREPEDVEAEATKRIERGGVEAESPAAATDDDAETD